MLIFYKNIYARSVPTQKGHEEVIVIAIAIIIFFLIGILDIFVVIGGGMYDKNDDLESTTDIKNTKDKND